MSRRPLIRGLATAAVALIVVFAQVGLVLAPSQLGRNPLLILALRPTPAFLVLVGDAVPAVAAVLVAAGGRTLVDAAYFAVGRYGALPLVERLLRRDISSGTRRTTRGLLTLTFFWSSSPVIAAISFGPTSARTFLVVTGLGNLTTSSAYVFLGHRFAPYLEPVTAWLAENATSVTLAVLLAVGLGAASGLRRRRATRPAVAPARDSAQA